MRKIVLHMGAHKTGSTTLQKSFAKHRDALAAEGVRFIGPAGPYPHLYSAFLENKSDFVRNRECGLSDAEIRQRDQDVLKEIDRKIEASPSPTIVLSSEFLCKLQQNEMAAMRAHFSRHGEVVAVYFYRDLQSWIGSDSQEMARAGRNIRPTTFRMALARVVDIPLRVAGAFGRDATTFIRFEDAIGRGICNSLLEHLGATTLAALGLKEVRANEGMSENAVRALFVFNRMFPPGTPDRPLELMESLKKLPGPKYQVAGFGRRQIAEYADRREEVQEKLELVLQDPETLPVSRSLDPLSEAIAEVLDLYRKRHPQ
ncbi:hypothetical protein [Tropicimonas marinistellae]|uniref:hypothetical protein n=1 Tax=Tropicimonas marinistellae TaxID=1739787 RepID=UPI000831E946|nr:hypothetical protein [Tropicimonas marinistellae]